MPPATIEALLFASSEPIEKKQLAKLLELTDKQLRIALDALSDELKGRGIALIETARDVDLRTSPDASKLVKKMRASLLARDLGKASLETLAVIAYHNGMPTGQAGLPAQAGVTRGEVDWVRGVNSSTSLRTLLIRGLCEGREDEHDKRRIRYSLTTEALAHLGLRSLSDLPRHAELSTGAQAIIDASTTEAEAEETFE